MNCKNVAIIGASANEQRFSHKAMKLLVKNGYNCLLVNPKEKEIESIKCYSSYSSIEVEVDTITLYIAPTHQDALYEEIKSKRCQRVIFNPGSENKKLESLLKSEGIKVVNACTLVMLQSNSFE